MTAFNRRDLVKALGALAATDPLRAVVAGILGGVALESQAQTKGGPRRYVVVYLEAGPSRWAFDLILKPKPDAPFAGSPGVSNGFQGGQPTYLASNVTAGGVTLHMPQLWAGSVPRPGGAKAPLSKLLTHGLFIRGVDMGSDGHQNNRTKQIYPLTGAPSLAGLVADTSTAPLPSVTLAGGTMDEAFFSAKGVGQLTWNVGDQTTPLQQFLDPFQLDKSTTDSPLYATRKQLDARIEDAVARINDVSKGRMPGQSGIFQDRANARRLLNKALGDVAGEYNARVAKYRALISACVALDMPGISDQPIGAGGIAPQMRQAVVNGAATASPLDNGDLRSVLTPQIAIGRLAEGFAVAEYLLTQDYGSAVLISAENILNLAYSVNGAVTQSFYVLDEHQSGTAISTLVLSFYYRSVAACIYELASTLKKKDLWTETVIHVCSEFSRSPRTDGSGSDHGYEAAITSVFSGAIKKPMSLGNVRVNSSKAMEANAVYNGTWGGGAAVDHDKTVGPLNIGHVTSSVAALLRVERPMKNFSPVVTVEGDNIAPAIEDAKNVG